MRTLDVYGRIAAAQIACYFPIAVCTVYLVFYYAFRRDAGWLFLFLFSVARMADGALTIAWELKEPADRNLFVAALTLKSSGLGLLLLSTIGFIGLAGQSTYSEMTRVSVILRTTGLVALAGIGFSAAGGAITTSSSTKDQQNVGTILRRVAAGIFAFTYILLFLIQMGCWTYHYQMRSYRRKLLAGLTLALPFLGVRVAYGILAAWSSTDLFGDSPSKNPTLAKFNPVSGPWIPFLVMLLIMEFIVAIFYLLFSTVLARRHS